MVATSLANGRDRRRTTAKQLRKSLHTLREDINSLGADVNELGHNVADLAGAMGEDAKVRFSRFADTSRDHAEHAVSDLQARVRERPGVALGVAAGAGLVLGLLLTARR